MHGPVVCGWPRDSLFFATKHKIQQLRNKVHNNKLQKLNVLDDMVCDISFCQEIMQFGNQIFCSTLEISKELWDRHMSIKIIPFFLKSSQADCQVQVLEKAKLLKWMASQIK